MNDENEDVLTNVVGALAECLKHNSNRATFRGIGGLGQLVSLLNSTYEPLLENVTKALCECAKDIESMHILEQLDAVRLIWSLLKNPCARVQAYAAWALCPCIKNARNSGELVRSFVGAMELVVGLLKSTDTLVLSATCAAIATIAEDRNNLAVLSDHKVISMLADLGQCGENIQCISFAYVSARNGNIILYGLDFVVSFTVFTSDDMLRENLAAAIASCAPYGTNTQELGRLRTVAPIVGYMISKNPRVHRTTAMALQRLSVDPQNCITMHQVRVGFISQLFLVFQKNAFMKLNFTHFFEHILLRAELFHFSWKRLVQKTKNCKKRQRVAYRTSANWHSELRNLN